MEGPGNSTVRSQEANRLCRSFSFELESRITHESPQSELALAVIEERESEDERQKQLTEWRKHFELWPVSKLGAFDGQCKASYPLTSKNDREPEIARLDVESNELTKIWALLREKLPPDRQVQFAKRPQEIGDVVSLVGQIGDEWQTERQKGVSGRTKASFRRMCSGLGSHSNLLNILPSSSHYVSIFCGTLQTLIQVESSCLTFA